MPTHRRVNWEFFAVVEGELAAACPGHPTQFSRDTLWVFSPACSHGWTGKKGAPADVIVFHFHWVSLVLQQMMPASGWLAIPLGEGDKRELKQLNALLTPHYWQPTLVSEAYADKALADLTLLTLRTLPQSGQRVRRNQDLVTINRVEDWIQTHLSARPSVHDAARATGLSESSLYRLLRKIRGISPQQAILKFKVERATELIANKEAKLDEIAHQCGFSNASALCRAFKGVTGCSPKAWQRERFIQYRPPAEFTRDHTMHGERLRAI